MPSNRSLLIQIHENKLDPKKEYVVFKDSLVAKEKSKKVEIQKEEKDFAVIQLDATKEKNVEEKVAKNGLVQLSEDKQEKLLEEKEEKISSLEDVKIPKKKFGGKKLEEKE